MPPDGGYRDTETARRRDVIERKRNGLPEAALAEVTTKKTVPSFSTKESQTMSRQPELRARVLRLLAREFRVEDLTRLLLWLRGHSYGAASIIEIGDFVAHADKRVKGIVTDELLACFKYMTFRIRYLKTPFDPSDLPSDFPDAVRLGFNRLGAAAIKYHTGISGKKAHLALESALSKLGTKPNGRLMAGFLFCAMQESSLGQR